MKKRKLIWYLYPSYLIITFVSLIAVTWYISVVFREIIITHNEESLEARAKLVKTILSKELVDSSRSLNMMINKMGKSAETRLTVIDQNGNVLADSEEKHSKMNNHSDRPEIYHVTAMRETKVMMR